MVKKYLKPTGWWFKNKHAHSAILEKKSTDIKVKSLQVNAHSNSYNFTDIIARFDTKGGDFEVTDFGSGHINDTFLVKCKSGSNPAYLLQKINNFVFKNIDGLMNNMLYVTNHLKKKVVGYGGNPEKEVVTFIAAKDGKHYYEDYQSNYWRVTCFLESTKSYDLVTSGKQAYQGGFAFGRFQHMLSDLDPSVLIDTIPDFLNIETRLWHFNTAKKNDSCGRLKSVLAEVGLLDSRAVAMLEIPKLGKAGALPLRVTHNDTKFNNILLDERDDIQCVIDLDTVMPGYVAYDFGDAIRSIINTAAEDESDLNAIQLNIPLFQEFTRGYLGQTKHFLTNLERKSLIMGVLLMPYMQSVRFLTDYLEGDIYYKTHFPGHNLQRARAQIQLFKMLELNRNKLDEIVQLEGDDPKTGC